MTYVKSKDGFKLYYNFINKTSKKTPIVFAHGWINDWTTFTDEINFFKKEGHPIIYFDFRGHGKSDVPMSYDYYKIELLVDDIHSIIVDSGLKRKFVLVGHSMGGMESIFYASKYSKTISRLVLIDTSYKSPDKLKVLDIFKDKNIFKTMYDKFGKKGLPLLNKKLSEQNMAIRLKHEGSLLFSAKTLVNFPPQTAFYLANRIYNLNLKEEVAKIKIPVLIIASKKDQLFSLTEAENMSKLFKKSLLKTVSGDHYSLIENSYEVSKEIKQFIYTDDSFF